MSACGFASPLPSLIHSLEGQAERQLGTKVANNVRCNIIGMTLV